MQKRITVLIITVLILFGFVAFLRLSPVSTAVVWKISDGGQWLLPLVVISSLIDSINPCAFSILLLTIAFLFSIGRMRSGILKIGGLYVLGVFIVYMLIGLGILQTLHIFNTPHFMAKFGASALIMLGLINLINEFFPSFFIKLKIPRVAHGKMAELMEKGSLPTAFLLGILVGICEFPCTGGPYLMILGLLHDQAAYLTGVGYLFLYNIIFVLPLLIILLIASDKLLLDKAQEWQRKESKRMRFWGGIAMVALGIIIFMI